MTTRISVRCDIRTGRKPDRTNACGAKPAAGTRSFQYGHHIPPPGAQEFPAGYEKDSEM